MTLKRNSFVVKFAYLFNTIEGWLGIWPRTEVIPEQTSLCAIFWRCVASLILIPMLIIGVTVAFPVFVVGYLGFCLKHLTWDKWQDRRFKRRYEQRDATLGDVIVEGVKAVKGRFCPIIQITD